MGPIIKLKHLINRLHLALDSEFYPEYLKRQGVRIGKNSQVLYPSYIDGRQPYLLEIGDDVVVSLNVTILTHDATSAYAGDLVKVGRVAIKDHSFIGANSTILCGVTIGPNTIVGAGSVVSRDLPPNTVCAGNPAKVICSLEEFMARHAKASKDHPLFKTRRYPHPYINADLKKELQEGLSDTYGYFSLNLQEGYPRKGK